MKDKSKMLFILRHAKSSWDAPDLADFDRPLNDRGQVAAQLMGEVMRENNYLPELILSSPAARAKSTAILVKQAAKLTGELRFDDRIYEASPQILRQVASEINDGFDSAMIVGHNPGIEGFIKYFTCQIEPVPTAALAVIKLEVGSWQKIKADCGTIIKFFRPKDIK